MNLAASLEFRDNDGNLLSQVGRAYWLFSSANNIDLQIGERKAVLVGTCGAWQWFAYNNERLYPFRPTGRWTAPVIDGDSFDYPDSMNVRMSLISTDTGETLTDYTFRIIKTEFSFTVEELL